MGGLVGGDAGQRRCPWALSAPEYVAYHDHEWGRPVGHDRLVLERICLEGFQSGLSWLTILRKRAAFRRAFLDFDPGAVAELDEAHIQQLLLDVGIVRHRGKIVAAIENARATVRLQRAHRSLAALCWGYEPASAPAPTASSGPPRTTREATALAGELKGLGFRYVGPVTVYSLMQSLGLVNDHLIGCSTRRLAEEDRGKFPRPGHGKGNW
ncbi:MAG: DNA-3-methyladenine glycosylase I [Candidatus Dormibacteria bacterium]